MQSYDNLQQDALPARLAVRAWGALLGAMQRCWPRGELQRGAHSWRQEAWKARASASFRYAGVRSQPPPNQAPPPTCSARPPQPAEWLKVTLPGTLCTRAHAVLGMSVGVASVKLRWAALLRSALHHQDTAGVHRKLQAP